VADIIYLNTAAIGRPTDKTLKAVDNFRRLRSMVGHSSIRSRFLLSGARLDKKDPWFQAFEDFYSSWKGFDDLAASIRRVLGVSKPGPLVLTSGTTNALDLTLSALSDFHSMLFVTDLEHESELLSAAVNWRGRRSIIKLRQRVLAGASADEIVELILRQLKPCSVLLISHVASWFGCVLPLELLCSSIRRAHQGVLIIADGAHAAGNIDVCLDRLDLDIYIGSGHKWLRGPETSGFAHIKGERCEKLKEAIRKRLTVAYSWFNCQSVSEDCGIGTKAIDPLVGLNSSLDQLHSIGERNRAERGSYLRQVFQSSITESGSLRLVAPRLKLDVSSISAVHLPRNGAKLVSERLEFDEGVVCQPIHDCFLRFSFSGDESETQVRSAAEALSTTVNRMNTSDIEIQRA